MTTSVLVSVLADVLRQHDDTSSDDQLRDALCLALQANGYPPDTISVTAADAVAVLEWLDAGVVKSTPEQRAAMAGGFRHRNHATRSVVSKPASATARPIQRYFETVEDVEKAMEHRLVLGQAQGILMERLGLTPERAFAFLNRASQQTNTKIHVVAAELVRTRVLPRTIPPAGGVPGPRAGD